MNARDCFAGFVLAEEAEGRIVDPTGWSGLMAGGPLIAVSPGAKANLLRIVEADAA